MSFQALPSFYPDQPNPYQYAQPVGVGAPPPAPATESNNPPKAHKRLCSIVGCKNGIVQGGLCVSHGAKRRKCRFPGCDKNSKCAGLCSKHGPPRKKCDTEGCNNVSVRGGKCKSHGAQTKRCNRDGCSKVAAFNGMCKRHKDLADASSAASSGSDVASPFEPPVAATTSQFYPPSFASQMLAASAARPTAQSNLSHVIAAQNRLGAGMGVSTAYAPPRYPYAYDGMVQPGFGRAFAGAMGYTGVYPYGGMRSNEERGRERRHQVEPEASESERHEVEPEGSESDEPQEEQERQEW